MKFEIACSLLWCIGSDFTWVVTFWAEIFPGVGVYGRGLDRDPANVRAKRVSETLRQPMLRKDVVVPVDVVGALSSV